jgi:RecB family exonuclease
MFINNISASRSDVIDQCLWKYNLKYNLKLPGFGSPNEDALNFGSFIHKVFELGYKESDSKQLIKLAESERSNYKVQFNMNDKITRCIENFIVFNSKLGETVSTERMFEIPLDKENDIKFIGIIDRVVKGSKGGYLVIDYKTSKKEKKSKDLYSEKQLMGYAFAIHEEFGVPYKDIYCGHFYPLTGNFPTVNFSSAKIWDWKKKEIDKVWRIRKKKQNEFPAQKNIFCDWCEYKQACPQYHSESEVCARIDEQTKLRDALKEAKELAKAKI